MKTYLLLAIFLLIARQNSIAQIFIGETEIDTTTLISGLDTPWEILWGPDHHIWLTERYGRISRLDPETGEINVIGVITDVHEQSEAGLLGMALHPEFSTYPLVYLVYNYLNNNQIKERLVRYTYSEGQLRSPEVLINDIGGAGTHNGSRLLFGPDGKLYMTTGDVQVTSSSQDPGSLNGKILRLNPDGTIPSDNPIPGSYVWSLGHRNPQGLVFSPLGLLYSSEHGPSNDDELNLLEAGRNYGWPQVHGFCDQPTETSFCNENNVHEPLAAWTPTLAVAGIDYYEHASIPEWQNSVLMTNLKASRMVALKLSENGLSVQNQEEYFTNWWGRLRDVCVSPDGRVILATSNKDGRGTVRAGDDRIVEIKAVEIQNRIKDNRSRQPRIFPNPAPGGAVQIEGNWKGENIRANIYSISGILLESIPYFKAEERIHLNLDHGPGIYFIHVLQSSGSIPVRLIVE